MEMNLRDEILKRDNFSCQKCGFDKDKGDLEIHPLSLKVNDLDSEENLVTLCSICYNYAPKDENAFKKYLSQKIDSNSLDSFRTSQHSISKKTKIGMSNKLKEGKHISKAPKGYKLRDKMLVPDETEAREVLKIFGDFLNTSISLTQLGKKYGMTTAGIKKLLLNTTYLGKVKFANEESQGNHEPLIEQDLFNKVQNKMKSKGFIKV